MTFTETRQIILDSLISLKLLTETERERLRADDAADIDLASLPIDSLKIVDWCMDLERKIGREVEIEELVEHDALNRLARHLSTSGQ